jgi:hypothetical protein
VASGRSSLSSRLLSQACALLERHAAVRSLRLKPSDRRDTLTPKHTRKGADDVATVSTWLENDVAPFEQLIQRRLVGVHGVRMVRSGNLEAEALGHSAHTPFVEIAVHSVQAAEFAAAALAEIADVSEETWAQGWSKVDGELTLRIHPETAL